MKSSILISCMLVCCACERVPEENAASAAPAHLVSVVATNTLPPPVFELAHTAPDVVQAASNGVRVSVLDDLCMLDYERTGEGLSMLVTNLPLGRAPRTLLATIRCAQPAQAIIAGYGRAGTIGGMNALVIDHAMRLGFWGYGADLSCDTPVPTQRWTSVAATYTGTTLTLYIDGAEVKTAAYTLDTPGTALQLGSKFIGAISDVRVWNKALNSEEIKAAHASSLAQLR